MLRAGHVVLVGDRADKAPRLAAIGDELASLLGRRVVSGVGDAMTFVDAIGSSAPAVVLVGRAVVERAVVDHEVTVDADSRVHRALALATAGQPVERSTVERSTIVDVEIADDLAPKAAALVLLEALQSRIRVDLGDRSYDVVIGPGARHLLANHVPTRARRAAVVTQEGIGVEVDPGIPAATFHIGDGEAAKSLATVEELCRSFARFGLTRGDVVVAVGGGVVTDCAGFAASCYHRGVAVIHVATSLLGQVDAAVGGKTGVNLPEGKNLVGSFWQPHAVLCDTDALASLPERELRSGLGEMAKYAFLGVDGLAGLPVVDQVARCVALKAEVVSADEREGDRRMLLNYGHTLAHALEAAGFADGAGRNGIDLRHGEAVAIGLIFAARLAALLGRIDHAGVQRHLDLIEVYDLPSVLPAGIDHDELLTLMGRDKKATDGLVFILDGPKGPEIVPDVPRSLVLAALEATERSAPAVAGAPRSSVSGR